MSFVPKDKFEVSGRKLVESMALRVWIGYAQVVEVCVGCSCGIDCEKFKNAIYGVSYVWWSNFAKFNQHLKEIASVITNQIYILCMRIVLCCAPSISMIYLYIFQNSQFHVMASWVSFREVIYGTRIQQSSIVIQLIIFIFTHHTRILPSVIWNFIDFNFEILHIEKS